MQIPKRLQSGYGLLLLRSVAIPSLFAYLAFGLVTTALFYATIGYLALESLSTPLAPIVAGGVLFNAFQKWCSDRWYVRMARRLLVLYAESSDAQLTFDGVGEAMGLGFGETVSLYRFARQSGIVPFELISRGEYYV